MLEFPFDIEGNHPWTPGALFLHHLVLWVGGKTYVERKKHDKTVTNAKKPPSTKQQGWFFRFFRLFVPDCSLNKSSKVVLGNL